MASPTIKLVPKDLRASRFYKKDGQYRRAIAFFYRSRKYQVELPAFTFTFDPPFEKDKVTRTEVEFE
jgi:hypothetical protein